MKHIRVLTITALFLMSSCFMAAQDAIHAPAAGSLAWWAMQAKAKGEQAMTLIVHAGLNGSGSSLQENVRTFTVVHAIPVEKKNEVTSDSITTWYRFKLLEVLSRPEKCTYCSSIAAPRAGFHPNSANEFMLPVTGGSTVVDGITITIQSSGMPVFKLNQPYILFLIFPGNGVAHLADGSAGAYQVDAKGVLHPESTGSPLLKQHVAAFGDLEHLRNAIKIQ